MSVVCFCYPRSHVFCVTKFDCLHKLYRCIVLFILDFSILPNGGIYVEEPRCWAMLNGREDSIRQAMQDVVLSRCWRMEHGRRRRYTPGNVICDSSPPTACPWYMHVVMETHARCHRDMPLFPQLGEVINKDMRYSPKPPLSPGFSWTGVLTWSGGWFPRPVRFQRITNEGWGVEMEHTSNRVVHCTGRSTSAALSPRHRPEIFVRLHRAGWGCHLQYI